MAAIKSEKTREIEGFDDLEKILELDEVEVRFGAPALKSSFRPRIAPSAK